MILSDFRDPGTHFGGLGAHFEDISRIFVISKTLPVRKGRSLLRSKCDHEPILCSVICFFDVFSSVHFSVFVVMWGARRLHFGSISTPFSEPWAHEKTAESL